VKKQRIRHNLTNAKVDSTYLLLQLPVNSQVDGEWVLLGRNAHGSVGDGSDSPGQIGNGPSAHLPLLGNTSSELSGIVLNILDVSLDLGPQLLQVLDDGGIDGPGEGRVGFGNDSSLVTDGVEDVLDTALTEELVSVTEGNLNDGSELGELLGGIGLDIGDSLEVSCRHVERWRDARENGRNGTCTNRASQSTRSRSGIERLRGNGDLQINILTMFFQAVNRSMRISEGLSS
jgi:hypothetical protein